MKAGQLASHISNERTSADAPAHDKKQHGKREIIITVISIIAGFAVHILVLVVVYAAMSPVGTMSSADALAYVALCAFPPLMLFQWFSNEFVAIANIVAYGEPGQSPWNVGSRSNAGSAPTWRTLIHRFQQNTMEQTLVTVFTVAHLSQAFASAKPLDVRLAVGWAIAFVVGRIVYLLGYSSGDPVMRMPGLMVGGFWVNASAAFYSMLIALGVEPSWGVALCCYFLFPMVIGVPVAFAAVVAVKRVKEKEK